MTSSLVGSSPNGPKLCFPDTIQTRRSLGYAEPIFLVLDGFTGHLSDVIEE
jgi:hypothetical protein